MEVHYGLRNSTDDLGTHSGRREKSPGLSLPWDMRALAGWARLFPSARAVSIWAGDSGLSVALSLRSSDPPSALLLIKVSLTHLM